MYKQFSYFPSINTSERNYKINNKYRIKTMILVIYFKIFIIEIKEIIGYPV